jgi:hypothetical protein
MRRRAVPPQVRGEHESRTTSSLPPLKRAQPSEFNSLKRSKHEICTLSHSASEFEDGIVPSSCVSSLGTSTCACPFFVGPVVKALFATNTTAPLELADHGGPEPPSTYEVTVASEFGAPARAAVSGRGGLEPALAHNSLSDSRLRAPFGTMWRCSANLQLRPATRPARALATCGSCNDLCNCRRRDSNPHLVAQTGF